LDELWDERLDVIEVEGGTQESTLLLPDLAVGHHETLTHESLGVQAEVSGLPHDALDTRLAEHVSDRIQVEEKDGVEPEEGSLKPDRIGIRTSIEIDLFVERSEGRLGGHLPRGDAMQGHQQLPRRVLEGHHQGSSRLPIHIYASASIEMFRGLEVVVRQRESHQGHGSSEIRQNRH